MKKIMFVLFFVFSSNVFCQSALMKGSYSLGGNIGFNSYSQDESSNSHNLFYFVPSIGYLIIDNLYAGINLRYTYLSSDDNSTTTIGIGPSLRYYLNFEKLNPFLGVGYSYMKSTFSYDDDEDTYTTIEFSIGADYFINDYFALEGSIDYGISNSKFVSNNNTNEIGSKSFDIGIGVKYFIF